MDWGGQHPFNDNFDDLSICAASFETIKYALVTSPANSCTFVKRCNSANAHKQSHKIPFSVKLPRFHKQSDLALRAFGQMEGSEERRKLVREFTSFTGTRDADRAERYLQVSPLRSEI